MVKIFKPAKAVSMVGKVVELDIVKLDANGCGVGRIGNKSIFIEGALVGERVSAKIIEQKSKYIKAKLTKVINASSDREVPKCQHYARCGGCELQHLSLNEQLAFKQNKVEELFNRQQLVNLSWQSPIRSKPWHYRRKARIGVQYTKSGEAIVGFRQRATNALIPIKFCAVMDEKLSDIFIPLTELANQLGKDAIGHIEVIATDETTLVVRQLYKLKPEHKALWQQAAQRYKWQIYFDDGRQLTALADYVLPNYHLSIPLDGDRLKFEFAPNHFIQINHDVNNEMVNQALEWLSVDSSDSVLDLFCGLGNFSLALAQRVNSVVGIEGVEEMVAQATANATLNGLTNCQFYQADLNSAWANKEWQAYQFTKALLDPARAGAFEACQQLAKLAVKQILYVSCDPTSLAIDSKVLVDSGYQIEKIAIMDMFSHTKHVESMVLFTRSN